MEDTVYSSRDRMPFVLTVSLRGKVSAGCCVGFNEGEKNKNKY